MTIYVYIYTYAYTYTYMLHILRNLVELKDCIKVVDYKINLQVSRTLNSQLDNIIENKVAENS